MIDSFYRGLCVGYVKKRFHRARFFRTNNSFTLIIGSKEGPYGMKNGSQPLRSESLSSMSGFQDDDNQGCPQGSWIVILDLKDVYWHIVFRDLFRKFLAFQVENWAYRFQAIPFRLNIDPRAFTKLMAVLKELRGKGVQIFAYLNDWLIWESEPHRWWVAL